MSRIYRAVPREWYEYTPLNRWDTAQDGFMYNGFYVLMKPADFNIECAVCGRAYGANLCANLASCWVYPDTDYIYVFCSTKCAEVQNIAPLGALSE